MAEEELVPTIYLDAATSDALLRMTAQSLNIIPPDWRWKEGDEPLMDKVKAWMEANRHAKHAHARLLHAAYSAERWHNAKSTLSNARSDLMQAGVKLTVKQ
jgi:hypothetical protein